MAMRRLIDISFHGASRKALPHLLEDSKIVNGRLDGKVVCLACSRTLLKMGEGFAVEILSSSKMGHHVRERSTCMERDINQPMA